MKRILIADDEPQMTRVLKLYLERAGYQVESASNGAIALTSIQNKAPDVLVTDIQMPLMTGKQLCLALAEEFPLRTFPIFVMTSMTDRDHREWTKKIVDKYLIEEKEEKKTNFFKTRLKVARVDKTADRRNDEEAMKEILEEVMDGYSRVKDSIRKRYLSIVRYFYVSYKF